ncbi:MAG: ABC transporter permease [Alphaproteobacteria bacterium]|nr:ABC transporter permease [Alphaproteobacteria bacterium]
MKIKVLVGFFKKEIISLLRDPVLIVAIMIMPVVQMILLSGAITFQATNLRLVVDSTPNDYIMTRIRDRAIGTGWFVMADVGTNDPIDAVQSGVADVAIIAPAGGLTQHLGRGNGQVQILIDSMNILKAQSIEAYLRGIITQTLLNETHTEMNLPINFNVRILYNPQLNTKFFMVPSMVAVLVFLALLILVTISITKEKETGTMETLIAAPISKYDIIIGKVVPYVLVSFLIMLSVLWVGMLVFRVPFVGSGWMFLLAFLVFCVPACASGVWLSVYTRTQQQALLGIVIVAFLALMLSGAIVPTENMPIVLRWISYINPLSHYSYLVRNIMLKGPDWMYFVRHASAMLAAGVVIWVIALRRFKTTL